MVLEIILQLTSQLVVLATVVTVYLATRRQVGGVHSLIKGQIVKQDSRSEVISTALSEAGIPVPSEAGSVLQSGDSTHTDQEVEHNGSQD